MSEAIGVRFVSTSGPDIGPISIEHTYAEDRLPRNVYEKIPGSSSWSITLRFAGKTATFGFGNSESIEINNVAEIMGDKV